MLTPENIMSELTYMLAESAVFESKLSNLVPGEVTWEEIYELEGEYVDLMNPVFEAFPYLTDHPELSDEVAVKIKGGIERSTEVGQMFVELRRGANEALNQNPEAGQE